ncbi:MAG: MFS transporter [Planctomycetota bacterium]|jgi:MFS family permease
MESERYETQCVPQVPPRGTDGRPPLVTRYTFHFHLRSDILAAAAYGIFGLSEVVARKGLGASDVQITVLTMCTAGFFVFSSFFGFRMEGRPKRPFIIWAGVVSGAALALVSIVSSAPAFILLCAVVFLAMTVFMPAQNSIFQSNYDPAWRGRMWGRVTMWTRWITAGVAIGAAFLLDYNPDAYRNLFPFAGVMLLLCYVQFALVHVRRRPRSGASSGKATLSKLVQILRENPFFFRYECNFMLYGIAFLMLLPVNVFMFVDFLNMTYREFSIARLVLGQAIVLAIMSPLAGRLFDRLKAPLAAFVAFASLGVYPLVLCFAFVFDSIWLAYVGMVVFGAAMAGVMHAWNLGAMHFSGDKDAAPFHGVHVTAVGIRGLAAPFLGLGCYKLIGLGRTYAIASLLLFVAALLMYRLHRRLQRAALS